MARGYLIFGDIEGKLDVLRVECTRCERKGRYSVAGFAAFNADETTASWSPFSPYPFYRWWLALD